MSVEHPYNNKICEESPGLILGFLSACNVSQYIKSNSFHIVKGTSVVHYSAAYNRKLYAFKF